MIEIEEISNEPGSLSRSCRIKVNHKSVITPTEAIGVTQSDRTQLDAATSQVNSHFVPLGEVYARVSLDFLTKVIEDDNFGRQFSLRLATRLDQLRDIGTVPYLMLSLVDNEGNPYNRLPPPKILQLLFDFLWGTNGNSIVVPPILGAFHEEGEYDKFISALEKRQKACIDRKFLPIMAVLPSSYRLIAPRIIERYWKIGSRVFAFDFENKKYGAFGYVIEKLHSELTELKKRDREPYVLHALNSKLRVGRGQSIRVNNLLATGFGFDSFGPNHGGRQRWVPPGKPSPPIETNYLFDNVTYGFFPLLEFINMSRKKQKSLLNTNIFRKIDISTIAEQPQDIIKKTCLAHNVELALREVRTFPQLIQEKEMINYFLKKEHIQKEVKQMKNLAKKSFVSATQKGLERWFT